MKIYEMQIWDFMNGKPQETTLYASVERAMQAATAIMENRPLPGDRAFYTFDKVGVNDVELHFEYREPDMVEYAVLVDGHSRQIRLYERTVVD